ncbi:MAG: hypothetical protein IJA48_05020 [Oscillospiraceae bacterium]|nr:hypothetical protein [Oscillospiraceae bacterium]
MTPGITFSPAAKAKSAPRGALFFCLPGASASGNESGTCGPNLTWTFYASTGELVISGYGEMDDFGLTGPWWIPES